MNGIINFLIWIFLGLACFMVLKGVSRYISKLIELWKSSRSFGEWMTIGLKIMTDKQYFIYCLLFFVFILAAYFLNKIR